MVNCPKPHRALPKLAFFEPLELTAGKSFFSLWIVTSILETSQAFIGRLLFWAWRERIFIIVWGRKKNRKWSHLFWNLKLNVKCSTHFSRSGFLSLFIWPLQVRFVCVFVGGRVHVFRPEVPFTSLIGSGSDQEAGNPDSSPSCSLAPGICVFLRVEVGG